jgi:hypothetical protein
VVRKIHASGEFTQDDLVPLRAIYNDPEFEIQAGLFRDLVASDRAARQDPPGDRTVSVTRLVSGEPACAYVEVLVDLSRVLVQPGQPRVVFVELHLTTVGADPRNLNPTPWSVADEDSTQEDKCPS